MCIEATYPGAAELARKDRTVELLPPGRNTFGHAHAILIDGPCVEEAAERPRAQPRLDAHHSTHTTRSSPSPGSPYFSAPRSVSSRRFPPVEMSAGSPLPSST